MRNSTVLINVCPSEPLRELTIVITDKLVIISISVPSKCDSEVLKRVCFLEKNQDACI